VGPHRPSGADALLQQHPGTGYAGFPLQSTDLERLLPPTRAPGCCRCLQVLRHSYRRGGHDQCPVPDSSSARRLCDWTTVGRGGNRLAGGIARFFLPDDLCLLTLPLPRFCLDRLGSGEYRASAVYGTIPPPSPVLAVRPEPGAGAAHEMDVCRVCGGPHALDRVARRRLAGGAARPPRDAGSVATVCLDLAGRSDTFRPVALAQCGPRPDSDAGLVAGALVRPAFCPALFLSHRPERSRLECAGGRRDRSCGRRAMVFHQARFHSDRARCCLRQTDRAGLGLWPLCAVSLDGGAIPHLRSALCFCAPLFGPPCGNSPQPGLAMVARTGRAGVVAPVAGRALRDLLLAGQHDPLPATSCR